MRTTNLHEVRAKLSKLSRILTRSSAGRFASIAARIDFLDFGIGREGRSDRASLLTTTRFLHWGEIGALFGPFPHWSFSLLDCLWKMKCKS